MSELEVEMSAGCDPSVAGCEVVEPLVSIELRALDPTTHAPPRPMGGTKATEADALADSFHVWLALPQDSFWVNLAPTESHRVIDSELGRTEVGKVMLDADLALKRTAATLLHPDHDVGAAFWDELYGWVGARPARLCHSFRQWIVPGVATMQITPRDGGAGPFERRVDKTAAAAHGQLQRGERIDARRKRVDDRGGGEDEEGDRVGILQGLRRRQSAEGRVPEVGVVQRVVGDVRALVEQRHRAGGRVAPEEEAREVDALPAEGLAHDISHLDRRLLGEDRLHERRRR